LEDTGALLLQAEQIGIWQQWQQTNSGSRVCTRVSSDNGDSKGSRTSQLQMETSLLAQVQAKCLFLHCIKTMSKTEHSGR